MDTLSSQESPSKRFARAYEKLFCDAFAVAALRRLKLNPGAYSRALRRMDVLGPIAYQGCVA